jgi:hypothetical protein
MGFLDAPIVPAVIAYITGLLAGKVSKGELVANVKDYGAVGDGVANDYTAFANAVAALKAAGGGTLLIPPGTYDLLSRVRLCPNIRVFGPGATITKSSTSNGYVVFYTGSDGIKGYGSGDSNIVIEGLTFLGNFATNGGIGVGGFHHSDNITIRNCRFIQCAGMGHVFDLNGCSNITIRDSIFQGFNNAGGGYTKEEAIQLDISNAASASGPDLAGSWDGLPTKGVLVDNCKFLPLTVGGTTYSAPNPLGSHALREGAVHSNIRFTNNYVLDPAIDSSSDVRGVLHFIGTHNIRIVDNTFELSTPGTTAVLGLYSTDQGEASATANNEVGSSNPIVTIAPLVTQNVVFRGNRFKNFGATNGQALINITPQSGSGNISAENILIEGNSLEIAGVGTSTTNFVFASYAKKLWVIANVFAGQGRPVNASNVTDLKVLDNTISSPRTDSITANTCAQVKIARNTITTPAATGIYVTTSTDVKVFENDVLNGGVAGARGIGISGCTRFGVLGNTVEVLSGAKGVEVYNTSAAGYVRSNIIFGGTATHVVFAGTNVTEDLNIKI